MNFMRFFLCFSALCLSCCEKAEPQQGWVGLKLSLRNVGVSLFTDYKCGEFSREDSSKKKKENFIKYLKEYKDEFYELKDFEEGWISNKALWGDGDVLFVLKLKDEHDDGARFLSCRKIPGEYQIRINKIDGSIDELSVKGFIEVKF